MIPVPHWSHPSAIPVSPVPWEGDRGGGRSCDPVMRSGRYKEPEPEQTGPNRIRHQNRHRIGTGPNRIQHRHQRPEQPELDPEQELDRNRSKTRSWIRPEPDRNGIWTGTGPDRTGTGTGSKPGTGSVTGSGTRTGPVSDQSPALD